MAVSRTSFSVGAAHELRVVCIVYQTAGLRRLPLPTTIAERTSSAAPDKKVAPIE
jgi:hypothetical protein